MDYSATFARHFARLVWLLTNEGGSVDEQKAALRALVAVIKQSAVALSAADWQLYADGQPVPAALTGVQDVLSRMAAHSVREIRFAVGCAPADLLGIARIIAAEAPAKGAAAHVHAKLQALDAASIAIETIEPVEQRAERAESFSDQPTVVKAIADAEVKPAAPTPGAPAEDPARPRVPSHDVMKQSPQELLAALRTATTEDDATQVLDDLVVMAEHSMRLGKATVVLDVIHGIVTRELAVRNDEIKRAYVMAIRRLSKPALLRVVATLILRKPDMQKQAVEVLVRMGEDGADALIEQTTHAQTADDRQALFIVLPRLPAAELALTRMLGDSRWFVSRNAADLLGELGASEAEGALIGMLRHTDDRVRRSATNALLKLGTPEALKAAYGALGDSSPQVRMHAAAAISGKKDSKTATTLIRAIDGEQDSDVQMAMIAALGKVATVDAVQRLVRIAEPDGRVFKKKTTHLRVAAVQALGEARTPAAFAALKELAGDKDREVRESASRALAHATG